MGRPCSWSDYPTLLGIDTWLEQVKDMQTTNYKEKKLWSKGDMHKAIIKALFNQPLAKNAVTTAEVDEATGRIITSKQQDQQVQAQETIRVDRLDLSVQQRTVFDNAVESFMVIIRPMEGMDRTINEYQDRMNRIATLVSAVSTRTDIPDRIRAALHYFIARHIRPFMINGVMPIIGG
jgi:hypothetical protein